MTSEQPHVTTAKTFVRFRSPQHEAGLGAAAAGRVEVRLRELMEGGGAV